MDTVSVIIPSFNRSASLYKAIHSVLKQTYPISEIFVCDDGSTDDSAEVVSKFNNEHVKWIDCGRNARPAIPRNIGIKQSTGEWLAFLDDDDEWLPEKIEKQLKAVHELNCKAVCSNAFVRKSGQIQKDYYTTSFNKVITFNDLISSNYVICSSAMFHSSLLQNVEGFPEEESLKALEDCVLWLRIIAFTNFAFLNESLVIYNDSPNESIRKMSEEIRKQRKKIFENLIQWSEKHKDTIQKQYADAYKFELKRWTKIKSSGFLLRIFDEFKKRF